jgi:hypothetical protein
LARTTLLNKEVEVTADPTQDNLDRYGRSLLYVGSPDDYSIAVTRAGWAKHYIFDNNPVQKAPAIEDAQQAAMNEKSGAQCAPPPPPPPAPTRRRPRRMTTRTPGGPRRPPPLAFLSPSPKPSRRPATATRDTSRVSPTVRTLTASRSGTR